jgi:hypothetical protein
MWAHRSWSCSFINIMLTCYIAIIGWEKTNQKHLTHHALKNDLSISCLHTSYLVQGYIDQMWNSGSWGWSCVGYTFGMGVLQMNVYNVFNSVFQIVIFQELRSSINTLDQLFSFVHRFYDHRFPLYYWRLLDTKISLSFHLNIVHDTRILWEECCLH